MFNLGTKSKARLVGVNPILAFAVTEAIKLTSADFTVLEGLRTKEQQRKNITRGVSWTMHSKHLTGNAVDLVHWKNGPDWLDLDAYRQIAEAMSEVIARYDLPIDHGYDLWKKDWPHWQMREEECRKYNMSTKAKKILKALNLI